jgi:uncharacterized membrane protein
MTLSTTRVEAFSDCVISIIITIMVFDVKFPSLKEPYTQKEITRGLIIVAPKLIAYMFSFVVLGIMWLNHHHMLHLIRKVDEKFLWLNLHLLFWMSLIPFPTNMLGGNPFLAESAATYGAVLFMSALGFTLLRNYATRHNLMVVEDDKRLNRSIDRVNRRAKVKNYLGMLAYFMSIPMSYVSVYVAYACFCVAPILFFIPDGVREEDLAERLIEKNEETAGKILP